MSDEWGGEPWKYDFVWHKTESEYLAKVVDYGIRRGVWNNSPVKIHFLNTRPIKTIENKKTGRLCRHQQCEICLEWLPIKSRATKKERFYVDHIIPCRPLTTLEDAANYIYDLVYCSIDNLQYLCFDCHLIKTHADKKNITFFEAKIDKEVIKIMKLKASELKKYLQQYGVTYVTPKKDNKETVRQIVVSKYNDTERNKYVLK